MTILDKIIKHKLQEVAFQKEMVTIKKMESSIFFESNVVSMKKYLSRTDKVGIIAEIKRASPSTGVLRASVDVQSLSIGYMQAGATALSVLTDKKFFGGTAADLETARKFNYCPILRKDFIIDEYQLIEAKSIGADCVLLIAACLTPKQCVSMAAAAKKIGLEVLLEVRDELQLKSYLNQDIDLVGVNNRNLHDFTTDINTSLNLADLIPSQFTKISESGITTAKQIHELKAAGYQGFLIGGHFMKHGQPEQACRALIQNVQSIPA